MHCIGEDRTERLDIVPAQLRVIVTVRPKYACRRCADGVTQAPAPAHLIEGGLPTEGALAHVLVSKYADHLPLYRQSQIMARAGVELHRSTLADWVGTAAFHLGPVVDRLAEHLKTSSKLFMDETTAPVLDPGRGRTKTGYLWALARDDRSWGGGDPPASSSPMRPTARARTQSISCRDLTASCSWMAIPATTAYAPVPDRRRADHRRPLLGACKAQAEGDLRARRLRDRGRGPAPDR